MYVFIKSWTPSWIPHKYWYSVPHIQLKLNFTSNFIKRPPYLGSVLLNFPCILWNTGVQIQLVRTKSWAQGWTNTPKNSTIQQFTTGVFKKQDAKKKKKPGTTPLSESSQISSPPFTTAQHQQSKGEGGLPSWTIHNMEMVKENTAFCVRSENKEPAALLIIIRQLLWFLWWEGPTCLEGERT